MLILCLVYWWFSAPSVRFGFPFMMLLPLFLIGIFASKIERIHFQRAVSVGFSLFCIVSLLFMYKSDDPKRAHLIYPADYADWSGTTTEFSGHTFYIPDSLNWISYYYFPSALNAEVFEKIEMRSDRS